MQFDPLALTFIASSWDFAWELVDFGGGPPLCFDHGALAPIVANFTPRRGGSKSGGVDVWWSGPRGALEEFTGLLGGAGGGTSI
jgi:hypothetical protein